MWPSSILPLLIMFAPPTSGATPNWIGEPIITRQMAFTIPYQIDRPLQMTQEPVEVQLFVSTDRGANWRLYNKVEPTQGSFLFRTSVDGEYWFTVRTLDRSGQLRPQGPPPILRVQIDTNPPLLQLKAQHGQAGQVTAQWEIRDDTLKPDSFRILYRLEGENAWLPVAVSSKNFKRNAASQVGEITWWPNKPQGTLQVRAECCDAAGNPAVSHAQVALTKADANATAQTPAAAAKPQTDKPAVAAAKPAPVTAVPNPLIANQAAAPAAAKPPVAGQTSPATPAKPAPATAASPAPSGPAASLSAQPPRMVSARTFELEYNVSAAGVPAGNRVELWATRDGGRTWALATVDDDNRSPLIVRTDAEGLFGFRLTVRTANGQGVEPPKPGDPPQVWIGVDLTPPAVRILRIQPVAGQPGQLQIAWEATDAQLAERPIALSCATTPNGPWLPIAGGLENSGYYTWMAGPTVPDPVFIRVEARDAAGNTASNQTPMPILLQRQLPTAQNHDVRPVGPSPLAR